MPRRRDENETAFDALSEVIRRDLQRDGITPPPKAKPEKMAARVKAGRKGGKASGKRRRETLTAKERKRIARKAAKARWSKK